MCPEKGATITKEPQHSAAPHPGELTPTKNKASSSCLESATSMSPICTASLSDASSLPSSPISTASYTSAPASSTTSSLLLDTTPARSLLHGEPPRPRPLLTRDDSSIRSPPVKIRRVYGRLPKFCPFLGTFQHAPSAGNRSRTAFFEQHLLSEDEHERRKRIKTNPFTGTFHFYPGRYSNLHGLQRFRHHAGFLRSFNELDRLEALGRRVTQKVREADNPSLAAIFMNGIFSTLTTASHGQRPSLYPHKSKEGALTFPDVGSNGGSASRYRYGGAVDISRKYGSSLDDCALLVRNASSQYREILYRWNGFRKYHVKHFRPPPHLRHRSFIRDISEMEDSFRRERSRSFSRLDGSLAISIGGGSGLSSSLSGSSYQGLSRVVSSPSMAAMVGASADPTVTAILNDGGFRSMRGGSPARYFDFEAEQGGGVEGKRDALRRQAKHDDDDAPMMTRAVSVPPPRLGPGHVMLPRLMTSPRNGMLSPRGGLLSPRGVTFADQPPKKPNPQQVKVTDKYDVKLTEILGEGSFAAVYGGSDKETGKAVAIKAIKRRYLFTEEEKSSVRNEIDNMKKVPCHRNVIRLIETFETQEHVYLVVERSTHGNLEQILQLRRKLTELEAMWVIKQLLDATEQMHDAGVLHCDIKPQNMLFSDVDGVFGSTKGKDQRMWMYTSPLGMVLKLCDFGLSRKVPDVKYFKHTGDIYRVPFSRICGTGGFIPPEIMRKQAFGKPADMWSIGVVCYRMLSGALPFIPATKCLDTPVAFRGRVWDPISKEAQDFVTRLLAVDQCRRATVKDALGHRWLQTVPEWGPLIKTSSVSSSSNSSATAAGGGGGGVPSPQTTRS